MLHFTKFSLKNPAAVFIMSLLLIFTGFVAFSTLKIENEPQVQLGIINILTFYPNAAPEDVLEEVTKPLEQAISNINGIKTFISNSMESQSVLTLSLLDEADREQVFAEVEKSIAQVRLPVTTTSPKAELRFIGNEPMYFISISNREQERTEQAFNDLIKEKFLYELSRVEGISEVKAVGTFTSLINIQPKTGVLHRLGISIGDLQQSLADHHLSTSLGNVTIQGEDNIVRLTNEYTSLEDLKQTSLFFPAVLGDTSVSLSDVATVEWQEKRYSISRLNQKQAVSLEIFKAEEANLVETGQLLLTKLTDYQQKYPDLDFIFLSDRLEYIEDSMGGMAREGIIGMIMAALVILLMLRHLKSTFIALISIPLSILVSIIFMAWFGITLNVMSLFGMAVAVGRVVDDSIVVIENVFRHFQLNSKRSEESITKAVEEVIVAITSSTLTSVAVFVPIAFVSGLLGDFFKPFAVAVVCSLLASLLVAITIVPVLAKVTMLKSSLQQRSPGKIYTHYRSLLTWSLRHKRTVSFVVLLLFISGLGLAARLPTGFLPELQMNQVYIDIEMPTGTSLASMDSLAQKIETSILEEGQEQLVYLQTKIGSAEEELNQTHTLAFTLSMQAADDVDQAIQRLQENVEPLIPIDGQVHFRKATAGAKGGYQVILHGANFTELQQSAEIIKQKLSENPSLMNIRDNLSEAQRQITLQVHREQAALRGFTPQQIARELNNLLGTTKFKNLKLAGKEIELTLSLAEDELNSLDKLNYLWVKNSRGQLFQLKDIASLQQEKVATQILRKDEQQYISISADLIGADQGGVAAQQTEQLERLALPEGVKLATEGVQQDMRKGLIEMGYAIGAAILFVFLIMVITFGNFIAPLSILASLPLATIGGFWGLYLSGSALDMTSLIGFLMLIGIVATNAIVLIDRVQQQLDKNLALHEALLEAGTTRLRPIIMTALATIVALLPLAFGVSGGSLLSKGLSVVVIGGLLSSTLLTLIVVPIAYDILYKLSKGMYKKKNTSFALKEVQ